MAYSPGPGSPVTGGGAHPFHSNNGLYPRGGAQSPSPPPANAPISKRDKRRSALQDRLQDLTASFSQNRDAQFRQQLHALQCDMTLINNVDPYTPGPLPDSADEVAQLIGNTVGGGKFGKEMASLSGIWYSRFVQEINQIKEDKDAELAMLVVSSVQSCVKVGGSGADLSSIAMKATWTDSAENMPFEPISLPKNITISPRRFASGWYRLSPARRAG